MSVSEVRYIGFWPRVGATVVDGLLLMVVTVPILSLIYGAAYWEGDKLYHGPIDIMLSWLLPVIASIWFWVKKQATPGKMLFSAKIVDAQTGRPATLRQLIIRYLAYFISMLPLGLGFLWVAFDKRKQGWHDKLANTQVIRHQASATFKRIG